MNGTRVLQQPAVAANTADQLKFASDVNSYRIGVVAEKLSMLALKDDPQKMFHLCLSLARGIDYGVANNEPPVEAYKLTPVLKQVCSRKKEFYLQSAIMVLMISVKNACKLGWFSAHETEELLTLADEVGMYFCTKRDINSETSVLMPTLSTLISRYYPQYKIGHIITSFEVKPGYGTYLVDFHITKDLSLSKDDRIRLLVAAKDNLETSSCIISPQQVNILLNGRPVEKRTNVFMDPGPQAPTIINQLLKYGTNLLQAVGQFNGHYILVIAAMSTLQTSDLPAPEDYVQPDSILSGADSEVIEGASLISLNCPISFTRIRIPAKGHMCKHYQCFDLSNYVELNSKRPSWRCPHCNQSVNFTDLRVDRMMVKVLQEAGENVSEVTIYGDGSWKVASSNGNDESHDKTTNMPVEHEAEESPGKSDSQGNVFDLTGEDYEMDTIDVPEFVDKKPTFHHNLQDQPIVPNPASPSIPRNANELLQIPFSQSANGGISGTMLASLGIAPVLTDAVSPSLNRQPNNFQGMNQPTGIGASQLSELQLQEFFHGSPIPRNVSRVASAIQALPVPMSTPSSQQHVRPTMSLPSGGRGPSVPFQMPPALTQQRNLQQSHVNSFHGSTMPTGSPQSRPASQGVPIQTSWMSQTSSQPPHLMSLPQRLSQPPHLMRSSQLSQPPHLMRSSQLSRSHLHQGVASASGVEPTNSPSSIQRVHLQSQPPPQVSQQPHPQLRQQPPPQLRQQPPPQVRQQPPPQVRQQPPILSSQTHLSRTSSLGAGPANPGVTPLAVSRTENLIDLQQADQSWRPTGRMRGALTGTAYSAALSQHMSPGSMPTQGQVQTPGPSPLAAADNLQRANRMIAQATQFHTRPTPPGAATNNENAETQGETSQGLN
ncbi:uncharacterized protein LOC141653627 isoform X2 [Silene latifolia]|uniref:uncharacterized protein LOC141653627 isoform X2 n=1 Tax=Silene latifolia TaxID=37657 RepID=UPI003D7719AB